MARSGVVVELGFLRIDGRKKTPLFQQIYDCLQTAILQGRLVSGSKIPSSRELVRQLGVSRTTVVMAIDQLVAEGYLRTISGSGTFVCDDLPQSVALDSENKHAMVTSIEVEQCLSSRGRRFLDEKIGRLKDESLRPFCPGVPAVDQFPVATWAQLVRRMWKSLDPSDLSYGPTGGYLPLRKELAKYLGAHRGVRCTANQVIITAGTQQAIDLIARLCLDERDEVLFENPGYKSAFDCFQAHGVHLVPLAVRDRGHQIEHALSRYPRAKLAYVTPSNQFPLGVTLPIEKRMALLEWAAQGDRLIVEDDYDSEFRYGQKPIPAMQGLDQQGRVLYVGSLSKVAFPGLGMGYLIVPENFVALFQRALATSARSTSIVDQFVLHEFMREGYFARHLRRIRKVHAERWEAFAVELKDQLGHQFRLIGNRAGLHCTALLKKRKNDKSVVKTFAKAGVASRALSEYYLPTTPANERDPGVVFGFACATPKQIRKYVGRIAEVI